MNAYLDCRPERTHQLEETAEQVHQDLVACACLVSAMLIHLCWRQNRHCKEAWEQQHGSLGSPQRNTVS